MYIQMYIYAYSMLLINSYTCKDNLVQECFVNI